MISKIGENGDNHSVIVSMTFDDWSSLQRCCGVPYDGRKSITSVDISVASANADAMYNMKNLRKDLNDVQKKWSDISLRLDDALKK